MKMAEYKKAMADIVSAYMEKHSDSCEFNSGFHCYIIYDIDGYSKVLINNTHHLTADDVLDMGFSENAIADLRYTMNFKTLEIICYTDFQKFFDSALYLYVDAKKVDSIKVSDYYLDRILKLLE